MSSSREAPSRLRSGAIDTVMTVALALLLAAALRTFLFQPFTVPSDSMEPLLRAGDYMLVSKFDYGLSRHSTPLSLPGLHGRLFGRVPRRGDVIVFKLPRDGRTDYVKRLVGLPGDRIELRRGLVFVNGAPWSQAPLGLARDPDDPARLVTEVRETLPDGRSHIILRADPDHEGENSGPYVVPQGQYFFLGDNRDNSADSRWPAEVAVGFVPAENLEGRVRRVLLSWKADAAVLKPWTWLSLRPGRWLQPVR